MSENTTTATTTTSFKPVSARQRQLITDLATELGREITVPASAKAASAVIANAIRERNEAGGDKPEPTAKQIRLLTRLGNERGKSYQIPATRKAASARIKQILASSTSTGPLESDTVGALAAA
jgi:hypothetical protein